MARKPTYEELEQRVNELEKQATEHKQAEEALKESEAKYRELVQNANSIVLRRDPKGKITFFNEFAQNFFGYTEDEIVGKNEVGTIVPEKDRAGRVLTKMIRNIGTHPERYATNENENMRRNGERVWIAWTNKAIRDKDGNIVEILSIGNDITERNRAQEALRESEEKYRSILEAIEDGYFEVDTRGNFTFFNDSLCKIHGYSRNELMGMNYRQYMDQETAKELYRVFNNIYTTGKPARGFAWKIIRKDGNQRDVESSVSLIRGAEGEALGFRGIGRDVTERVRTEEALRRQTEYLAALNKTTAGLISRLELNELLEAIVARAGSLIGTQNAFIYLYDPEKGDLETRVGLGTYKDYVGFRTEPGKGLAGKVWETGQPLVVQNYSAWPDRLPDRRFDDIRAVIGIPLKSGTGMAGVIGLDHCERIGEQEISVLSQFAELASVTLDNAQLYTKVQQELSERRQAEQALRESEEKYRSILKSIEESYYEVDLTGNLTFFNDSTCRILGYSRDELIDMNNQEFMDQQNAGKIYKTFNKVYSTGEPAKGTDWAITRKDGTKKYVEASVSLIRDVEGQPIGFRGIGRDVTERKQMEGELIQTKNFLQSILDSSVDGITTTDLHGTVTYTTPKVKDILGYEQAERIGRTVSMIYANGKEDARAIMKELRESGELRDHEMRLIRKDGQLIDINLSSSLLRDESGEVIGTLGIYRDITEKKKLQAQFQAAQRMEAVGTLAGGIAHNFNNLLMAIQGNASLMLLKKTSDHPDYERLKSIEQGVRSGAELTKHLLGFAMGGKYEVKPTDMNELIQTSSDMFGKTKKQITIHTKYQEGIWPVEVDQGQTEQVLLNLYVNAWQAMPGGGELYLETENVTLDDKSVKPFDLRAGRYVKISVTDTGAGMDEATRQRIFEPFFTTKEMGRGTGLGLASMYGIIKNHDGIITVHSVKGKGTTFTIHFPASEKGLIKEEQLLPGEVLRGTETVLLVDDEDMVLEVGEQMLKELGYKVLIARSGKKAIEIVSKAPNLSSAPDIVILDMIMPAMGGGETHDRLKEINPNIKVLLSSGYSIDGQAREILDRGCNGFIQKPFSMRELSGRIRGIIDQE